MRIDLGDVQLVVEARVHGLRPPTVLWRVGPVSDRPRPLPPAVPVTHPTDPHPAGVDLVTVLKADQKITYSLSGVDEMDNPVPLDGDAPSFAVDREDVVTIEADGFSVTASATGALGTAVLSASGATASGLPYQGSVAIDVVAGDVAGVRFSEGVPEEVTPDA